MAIYEDEDKPNHTGLIPSLIVTLAFMSPPAMMFLTQAYGAMFFYFGVVTFVLISGLANLHYPTEIKTIREGMNELKPSPPKKNRLLDSWVSYLGNGK
jgi:hypothetical protein